MKLNRSVEKELILFSLPLIFSGILQQLYSWADAFIVGHVQGEMPLAAIGASGSISGFLVQTILGFTLGLSILAAQNFGRGDRDKIQKLLSTFLPLLGSVYLILCLAAIGLIAPILRIMDTPEEIFPYAQSYLRIVLLGVPFLAVYNLIAALLRAIGNTKAAFYAVILSSLLNVALDILFVALLRLGVAGAALATVLSQAAMTVFILLYAAKKYPILRFHFARSFSGDLLREGFSFGLPPMIQNSVTSFGNLILQNFMNSFGASTVLAITTAYRVDSLMLLPILNLGAAISSMTARACGAGQIPRMRRCLRAGLWMMIFVAISLSLVMFFFGAQFVGLFGVTGQALEIGQEFFRDLSIFYTFFGISVVLRSFLEGIGDIAYASGVGIGFLALRIGFSYLLRPLFAQRTIAFAEGIAWIMMLLALWIRYFLKKRQFSADFPV